ncbi:MAG: hypothetical protein K9J17_10335 [Flavobacteriales bacterium]|nr:hypothetical protein [Flavobacteriales bacterium]
MKTLLTTILSIALLSVYGQTIPRHNVFFAANSSELTNSPARVVEAVYTKLPVGQQIRFGITGPISNVHDTMEKNRITAARAHNIIKLLKQISNEDDVFVIQDISNPYLHLEAELASRRPFELEVILTKSQGKQAPIFTRIDDFLPLPVQTFTINPREDNRLVGNQGTVVNIAAFTLELKNGSVPSEMTVELKEVYGGGQLIQANLHTASSGRMLQSGGTIHIDANTNGKPAQVASGKSLELEFPHGDGEPSEAMEVFNGRIDRAGNFDWVQQGKNITVMEMKETFYINGKEVTGEEYYARMQAWENRKAEREREEAIATQVAANENAMDAYLLKSDQLGWINCDAFYDIEEKTNVIVYVDTTFRPSVRMVFDNINSVMGGSYDQRAGTVTFSGVPVGESVRLVGYSIMDGTAYMANRSVIISNKLKQDLKLVATTKQEMEAELASLN